MADSSNNFVYEFDSEVEKALALCGVNLQQLSLSGIPLGAAVSGGADSVSLLISLSRILKKSRVRLEVITVNHNIRAAAETCGDAAFVVNICSKLKKKGFDVNCSVKELRKGLVAETAEERGNGIEDAARYLRYKAFDEFISETGAAFICLAHNCNDQLETVLMRFLQGSGGAAAGGIRRVRGIFVRPLLDIPRSDIELYLISQNIKWRTDSTNYDEAYLRNKIRGRLMPFLDGIYPGWRHSVITGARKAYDDDCALSRNISGDQWSRQNKDAVVMPSAEFKKYARAIRARLLYEAFSQVSASCRVPYRLVEKILDISDCSISRGYKADAAGIEVEINSNTILVKKKQNIATEYGFFVIIEKSGNYDLPCGTVSVSEKDGKALLSIDAEDCCSVIEKIPFPFCVRSRQPGDSVQTAAGGEKPVADVLSSWHVPQEKKNLIPLVQELAGRDQKILCIWGSTYGFEDWIVRG